MHSYYCGVRSIASSLYIIVEFVMDYVLCQNLVSCSVPWPGCGSGILLHSSVTVVLEFGFPAVGRVCD